MKFRAKFGPIFHENPRVFGFMTANRNQKHTGTVAKQLIYMGLF